MLSGSWRRLMNALKRRLKKETLKSLKAKVTFGKFYKGVVGVRIYVRKLFFPIIAWDICFMSRALDHEIVVKSAHQVVLQIRDRARVKEMFKYIKSMDISATRMSDGCIACLCPKGFIPMEEYGSDDDAMCKTVQEERSFILKDNMERKKCSIINMECGSGEGLTVATDLVGDRSDVLVKYSLRGEYIEIIGHRLVYKENSSGYIMDACRST